ncbi:cob(I)yrinic acid a,c-diamide adenosyltransferase [Verrucomicrobiota bacterium]
MKGYVQVYTGKGKGKTTAALGLIMRACGAGLRVYLGQFIKKKNYSEIKMLNERFPDVTVEQYGRGCFIKGKPLPEDIDAAQNGLAKLRDAMLSGEYNVIIADEANVAISLGLFPVEEILRLIDDRPENVEMVFTGRDAHERLVDRADLVTEMKDIKHYYDQGVSARTGIEK